MSPARFRINRRFFLGSLAATTVGLPVGASAEVVAVDEGQNLPDFASWHIGLITACRPGFSIDENKSRNSDLLFELGRFGRCHIRGRYIENYGTAKARPVEEHSFLVRGNDLDSGNLKGFLRTSARRYEQAAFIYKPYHKNAELHIFTDVTQTQGQSWEINPLGPFHPNRIAHLHVMMTRGEAIGWNFTEKDIQSATKGIDLFGGRWEDVDCWTLKSFSNRGIERRVNFQKEHCADPPKAVCTGRGWQGSA